MPLQTWVETLTTQHAAGTSFGSFTTAKTVINPQCLTILRAGFWIIGKKLRITVKGGIGSLVTTPGTITFQVMNGSVIAFTTGAIQLNASGHTALPFKLVIDLVCRAEGNSTNANLMGSADVTGVMFTNTAGQVDGVNSNTIKNVPATAMAVGAGFDSTTDQILDFWAGFSINDATNTIIVQDYEVQALN